MKYSEIKRAIKTLRRHGWMRHKPYGGWYKQWECPKNFYHYRHMIGEYELVYRLDLVNLDHMLEYLDRVAKRKINDAIKAGS